MSLDGFHVKLGRPDLGPVTIGYSQFSVFLGGDGNAQLVPVHRVSKRNGRQKETLETRLDVTIRDSGVQISSNGKVQHKGDVFVLNESGCQRLAEDNLHPELAGYLVLVHNPNLERDAQYEKRQDLALRVLGAAFFGGTEDRADAIRKEYGDLGLKLEESVFAQQDPTVNNAIGEVYQILELDPSKGSVGIVSFTDLPPQFDYMVKACLKNDRRVDRKEGEALLRFVRGVVGEKDARNNRRLIIALSEVLRSRVSKTFGERAHEIAGFVKGLEDKVRDRVLDLEELADIDYRIGLLDESDPTQVVLRLLNEMYSLGIDNELSSLGLPEELDQSVLGAFQLQHHRKEELDRLRVHTLEMYRRLHSDDRVSEDARCAFVQKFEKFSARYCTDWHIAARKAMEALKRSDVEGIQRVELEALQRSGVLEEQEIALLENPEPLVLNACMLDLLRYTEIHQMCRSLNRREFDWRLNREKVERLLNFQDELKRLAPDKPKLFYSLVFDPMRDEEESYVNGSLSRLEEALRDPEALRRTLADDSLAAARLKDLNRLTTNKYVGKRVTVKLNPNFSLKSLLDKGLLMYETCDRFHAAIGKGIEVPKRQLGEGGSLRLSMCLERRPAYAVGTVCTFFSDRSEVVVEYLGKDHELADRIGLAAAILIEDLRNKNMVGKVEYVDMN